MASVTGTSELETRLEGIRTGSISQLEPTVADASELSVVGGVTGSAAFLLITAGASVVLEAVCFLLAAVGCAVECAV